jgi:hypothetical protein
MDDHPRTRALLAELCGLDETDALLPLVVIANVYRGMLRLPLLGMVPLLEDYIAGRRDAHQLGVGVPPFRDVLAASYQLEWVPFMKDKRVDNALDPVDYRACTVVRARQSGLVRQLLDKVANDWQGYELLALLYYAGYGVPIEVMLTGMELSLEVSPNLHAFTIERAKVAALRPVQSE